MEAVKKCEIYNAISLPKSGNMTKLPEKILARKDLLILVTGALSCVRGIYKTVRHLGGLHQFAYCLLDEQDYLTGSWEDKYIKALNKVLLRPGLGGIIIYSGCLDCFHKVNIHKIKDRLANPKNIPIEVLFRGPVSAGITGVKPMQRLTEILEKLPATNQELEKTHLPLPMPLPDYAGVGELLQAWGQYNLLLEIGGCSPCLTFAKEKAESYCLKKTSFAGFGALKNYQENLLPALVADYAKNAQEGQICCMASAALIKNVPVNYVALQEGLAKQGIKSRVFATDAYKTYEEGVSDVLLSFAERIGKHLDIETSKTIGVLATKQGMSLPLEKFAHGLEHLAKDGFKYQLLDDLPLDVAESVAKVDCTWAVSCASLALAQEVEKKQGVPYLVAFPVGMYSMKKWRNKFYDLFGKEKIAEDAAITTQEDAPKVLVIGDAILSAGIKEFLVSELGYKHVTRAVYTPLASTRAWYKKILSALNEENVITKYLLEAPVYFGKEAELCELASDYDFVLADELLLDVLRVEGQKHHYVDIPDNVLSEGFCEHEKYTLFGKKGAAWLKSKL